MSHQKTKRIESPLKGMTHSMLIQNHQPTIFSSRITQKRKPIFDDTPCRSSVSRSNSVRRKIFSKTEKSQEKAQNLHFSKLFQAQQHQKQQGLDLSDYQIQQQEINDSVQSSSIEQDNGLADVKRQLFPATPIKRINYQSEELQNGRQWLTNNSKHCNKKLFEEILSPPKSNHSISTNNVQKTIFKFNYNTPQRKQKPKENEYSYQHRTQLNSQNRPSSFVKNLNLQLSARQHPSSKQPQKDIAKQLRELHQKMLRKTKVCSKVDHQNQGLKEQNDRLREQNQRLKSQQLRMSLRPQSSYSSKSSQNEQVKKLANENIYVKVKAQKARNMVKNLLELSQAESMLSNSIINIQQTLKQVLKELQF